jgi:hypothetical protein
MSLQSQFTIHIKITPMYAFQSTTSQPLRVNSIAPDLGSLGAGFAMDLDYLNFEMAEVTGGNEFLDSDFSTANFFRTG